MEAITTWLPFPNNNTTTLILTKYCFHNEKFTPKQSKIIYKISYKFLFHQTTRKMKNDSQNR